jgi:oxygen-dependent protoporphyrinogen oxidase
MDALAKAFSEKITRVRCGEAVTRITVNENSRISVFTGGGLDEFDQLVIATTSNSAYKLTRELALIDEQQKQFLNTQQYSSNVNVGFWIDSKYTTKMPTHNQPTGKYLKDIAAIVVQGIRTKDAIDGNQKMEKVVVYFLDCKSKSLINRPDAEISRVAFEAIQSFFPQVESYTSIIHVTRHQEAIPIPEVGRFKLASAFIDRQKPPVVFAGDYLSTSCIEGAIFSGQQAVELLS